MARNVWSDRPLGVKLAALVAAGGAVAGGADRRGGGGVPRRRRARPTSCWPRTHATAEALEADMMHDAVRGDVLQALVSDVRARCTTSAVADLGGALGALPRASSRGSSPTTWVPTSPRRSSEVSPVVEAYLASAAEMVAARRDRTPRRPSGPTRSSLEAFTALEDALPTVSDAITAYAAAAAEDSRGAASTAITLALVVAGVGARWCWASSAGSSPARWSVRCAGSAPSWPPWPTATCAGTAGVDSKDEVGRMAAALEASMDNMRSVMTAIGDSSTTLASATEQLSASAQDMARLADESSTQSAIVAERRRAGVHQRADRGGRIGADGLLHPRDRPERQRGLPRGRSGGRRRRTPPPRPSPSWGSPRWRSPASSR